MEQLKDAELVAILKHESTDDELDLPASHPVPQSRRRLATVYDAVAGRVLYDNVLRDNEDGKNKAPRILRQYTRETPLAPGEVLFRRKDAPQRYAEYDVYNSHERDLPDAGRGVLPESDLLKAVHGYASRFYGAMDREPRHLDDRNVDERSLDETALLAFGILLEEAAKELLGRRGDLVFTEAADPSASHHLRDETERESDAEVGDLEAGSSTRASKRRKIVKSDDWSSSIRIS